jgi:O-antigen ligase
VGANETSSISRAASTGPLAGDLLAQATYLCTLLTVVCTVFRDVEAFPGVSIAKAVGIPALALWLLWTVARLGQQGRPWVACRKNLRVAGFALLLLCAIVTSTLFAPPSPLFLGSSFQMVLNFGLAVLVWSQFGSRRALTQVSIWLAVAGTAAAVLVIVQYSTPGSISHLLGQRLFVESFGVRAVGPFRDPNYGALSLLMIAGLTAGSALAASRRAAKALLACCLAVQLAAVLLTFSRAGLLTLGVVALLFLWQERHRLARLGTVIVVASVALVAVLAVGPSVRDLVVARTSSSFKEVRGLLQSGPSQSPLTDLSIVYRYKALIGGWNMILAKFPAGVGWENFRFVLPEYVSSPVPNMVAHNMYVTVVAELGLPGLIALAALLFVLYRYTSLATRHAGMRNRRLAQGLWMALAAGLVGSLFLNTLAESLLWVVVGLIMAQNEAGQRE